jgi:pilus assembly protein Flp/PilA
MGSPERHEKPSNARGRFAAHSLAARSSMKNFARDTRGATAIEYGLISALICLVIITAISSVGTTLSTTLYGRIASSMAAATP